MKAMVGGKAERRDAVWLVAKPLAAWLGRWRASRVRDEGKGPDCATSGHVPSVKSWGNQGHGEIEKDAVET